MPLACGLDLKGGIEQGEARRKGAYLNPRAAVVLDQV
jgi:hypothetical protein